MVRKVTVAVTQFPCSWDIEANLVRPRDRAGGGGRRGAARRRRARLASGAIERRRDPALRLCSTLFRSPLATQNEAEKLVREAAAAGANIILLQARSRVWEGRGEGRKGEGTRKGWRGGAV